jgi:hypothetical protein
MRSLWGTAAFIGLALGVPGVAAAQEDDLLVVKRAVKQEAPTGTAIEKVGPVDKVERIDKERLDRERAPVRRGARPQWLRVRVLEKGGRKKVSVNLPLALVRALGDDFDLGWLCGRHGHHGDHERHRDACPSIRLSEVLAALDSGEDLVQVDEEDATVRVWVE